MPLDNSTIRQPADGAIGSSPSVTRSTLLSCPALVARPAIPVASTVSAAACRSRANDRHACPRVSIALTGLVPNMCDDVDIGCLRAQISSARVVLRDVPEGVE